jgi:hypothetical protein
MHARGHNGVRERAVRLLGWLRRRWRRAVLVLAVLTVIVPLGADVARSAMSGNGWSLGEAFGSQAGDVDFDEIDIDEPSPDEVVDSGYAPDPEFFSDAEITDTLGQSGIPEVAFYAYVDGADLTNSEYDGCGLPWSVLAAIGRVESNHGRFGGAMLRVDGYGTKPIRGIPLDGRPGIALVEDTDYGELDGDDIYDRAVGPMQIIPSTWDAIGVDNNDDFRTDPNNIFDAAAGAGLYLCNGDVDLTQPGQLARAVRRYNHTDEYVRVVLELASAYDSGEIEPTGVDPASLGETPMDPVIFEDFEDVDPSPYFEDDYAPYFPDDPEPEGPSAPAPEPQPNPEPPATAPQPVPTPTTQPAPPPVPPTTAPPPTTTTAPPATTTTVPPTPTTRPGGPSTTVPPTPTTVPGEPTTTAPPSTEAPAPTTTSPAGDTSSSIPPASVGWSPTMLDFVTTTVAQRAAECSAPEPSPAPTQPSEPAPNAACPATAPPEEGQG